jgi:competence protein ComEC
MGAAGTVLGLAAAAMSLILPPVGRPILWTAGQFLALGTALARWFVALPFAWVRAFTPTLPELAIVYAMLALWLCRPMPDTSKSAPLSDASRRQSSSPQERRPKALLVLAGALVAALATDAAWWIHRRYFNRDLRITFVSVGQGDCAVVRFPGARVMVVDAGGQFGEFDPGERILAPFLWSQKIMHVDYMVLSHPELDHFGGFDFIARNFSPAQFWTIANSSPDIKYVELLGRLAEAGVRLKIVDASLSPLSIGGVGVRCLNPRPGGAASRNNSSMVLRLDFGPTSVLFTGDLEAAGERALMERVPDLRATILKAPHHGSATSSSDRFVESVHPAAVVISVGYRNRFDFPAVEVVDRFRRIGARVLRTDLDGAVEVDATGTSMALSTGRPTFDSR